VNQIFKTYLLSVGCCVFMVISNDLQAEERATPSAMQRFASGMNPVNWKMPDFGSIFPSQEEQERVKEKKESFFSEVSATASKSWAKTKEVFSPSRYNPTKFFSASHRSKGPQTTRKEPGFWSSLFTTEPEPQEINNVNDFLRQSRPKP